MAILEGSDWLVPAGLRFVRFNQLGRNPSPIRIGSGQPAGKLLDTYTEQLADGLYLAVITGGGYRAVRKVAVVGGIDN